ncbi:hypothetical protein ACFFUE_05265 [Bergeyella porcorum]|uniref:hypothetical protein n=1 Tax=Bergeyella porcorum TaxID=1735111 RepID=UPI0035E9C275
MPFENWIKQFVLRKAFSVGRNLKQMGFTSYLEDIISKSEDYKHFLDEYNSNQKDSEKINVHRVFDFIRECKALLNRIKKN